MRITTLNQDAYLAGLLDADGSFGLHQNGKKAYAFKPYIALYNIDMNVLNWAKDHYGGRICKGRVRGENRVASHEWRADTQDNILLVGKAVLPYLIVKKIRANLLLHYIEIHRRPRTIRTEQAKVAIYDTMQMLNGKGQNSPLFVPREEGK